MTQDNSGNGAPQNPAPPAGTPPANTGAGAEVVTIPKAEWEKTKHIADVSSQNFERLQKANETIEEYKTRLAALDDKNPLQTPVPSNELESVRGELATVKTELSQAKLFRQYPVLEQAWPDFTEWHAKDENKAMPLESAAKVFMAEKGLLEPRRPGLQPNTGGQPQAPKQGMSAEEVKALREGDGRKYREALMAGKIQIAS